MDHPHGSTSDRSADTTNESANQAMAAASSFLAPVAPNVNLADLVQDMQDMRNMLHLLATQNQQLLAQQSQLQSSRPAVPLTTSPVPLGPDLPPSLSLPTSPASSIAAAPSRTTTHPRLSSVPFSSSSALSPSETEFRSLPASTNTPASSCAAMDTLATTSAAGPSSFDLAMDYLTDSASPPAIPSTSSTGAAASRESIRRTHPLTETSEEGSSNAGDSSPLVLNYSEQILSKGPLICSPHKEKQKKAVATHAKKSRFSSTTQASSPAATTTAVPCSDRPSAGSVTEVMSLRRQIQFNTLPRFSGDIPPPKHLSSIRSVRRILDPRHFLRFVAKHAKDILTDPSFTMKKLVDLAVSYFVDVSFAYKHDATDGSLTTPAALSQSESIKQGKAVCFLIPRYGNCFIRQVNRHSLSPQVSAPLNTSTRAGLLFLQLRYRFQVAMHECPNASPQFFYCMLANLVAQFLPPYLVLERVSTPKPKIIYHARLVDCLSLSPEHPGHDLYGQILLRWSTDSADFSRFNAWATIQHSLYRLDPFNWQYRDSPSADCQEWSLFDKESRFSNCIRGPPTPVDHLGINI